MTEIIKISNIKNYIQVLNNGELILTPKQKYIIENEINMIDFKGSKIQTCIIKQDKKDISINRNKYSSILIDIWKTLSSKKILQTTTFNFKISNENGNMGYHWCPDINMSFQSKDSSGSLKEILNIVKINNMSIYLSIKLKTDKIIIYKID